MPLYIDRHDGLKVPAEQIAAAHLQDLEVESAHDVHYHTYWIDEDSGSIFCLAEGPTREAVAAVHRESHGLVADQILELPPLTSLNEFFGSIPRHPPGEAFSESPMRAIVFTDMCGSVAQVQSLGDDAHVRMLDDHDEIVREQLVAHQGREVKHTGDGILAAFTSVTSSVEFSTSVLRILSRRNVNSDSPFDISIGISAGEPVTRGNDDLFGAAVQMAARLCAAARENEILVASVVRELCAGKKITFADRGELSLKGLSEPARAFAVAWED